MESLKKLESELLGKNSVTTQAKRSLGGLEPEERRELGFILNETRTKLEDMLSAKRKNLFHQPALSVFLRFPEKLKFLNKEKY